MQLIERESQSTKQAQADSRQGARRPVSKVAHTVVTLADGHIEYWGGTNASIRAAYAKHRDNDNGIVNLRCVAQPLHLIGA